MGINKDGEISTTWTPTTNLRWLEVQRIVPVIRNPEPPYNFSPIAETITKLQQMWRGNKEDTVWRDIPTEIDESNF
jgi:hypothetical protein